MAQEREISVRIVVNDDGTVSLRNFGKTAQGLPAKVTPPLKKIQNGFTNVRRSVLNLRNTVIGLGIGIAMKRAAQSIIDTSSSLEQYRFRLAALLGTQKAANEQIRKMREFAAGVPHELEDIIDASVSLTAFGAAAEKWIAPVGDLAFVMGVTLREAGRSVGRAFAAGAGAADILRERGILALIRIKSGVDDLTKLSLPEFRAAMLDAFTDPDGQIAGASEKAAKTLKGIVSLVQDALFSFRISVGEAGAFDSLKDDLQSLVDKLKEASEDGSLQRWAQDINDAYQSVRGAIVGTVNFIRENATAIKTVIGLLVFGKVSSVIGGFVVTMSGAKKALGALVAPGSKVVKVLGGIRVAFAAAFATPVGLALTAIATGIAVVAKGLSDFQDQMADTAEITRIGGIDFGGKSDDTIKDKISQIKNLKDEMTNLQKVIDRATETAADEGFVGFLSSLFGTQDQATINMQKAQDAMIELRLELKSREKAVKTANTADEENNETLRLTAQALTAVKKQLSETGKAYQKATDDLDGYVARQTALLENLSSVKLLDISDAGQQQDQAKQLQQQLTDLENFRQREQLRLAQQTAAQQRAMANERLQDETQLAGALVDIERQLANRKVSILTASRDAMDTRLQQSLDKERAIADQIVSINNKIRSIKESTEEKIFNLRLRGMNQTEKLEALEERALGQTGEKAIDAWTRWAEAGGDVDEAIEQIQKAEGQAIREQERAKFLAQQQAADQREATEGLIAQFTDLTKAIDGIVKKREALGEDLEAKSVISVDTKAFDKFKASLSDPLHQKVIIETVQPRSQGGPIVNPLRARSGRFLPGFGGGDRRHALLEDGEFVLRKEAVREYGLNFISALNAMRLPPPIRRRTGGVIGNVSSGSAANRDTVDLNFNIGDKQLTGVFDRDVATQLVNSLSGLSTNFAGR